MRSAGPSLQGRVAVVTGACGALGRAIASRLEAEGTRVARWDVRAEAGDAAALVVDVTNEVRVAEAVDLVEDRCGPIDILVNNAGTQGPFADVVDTSLADWDRVIRINLTGTFLCSRAIAHRMRGRGRGRIVNVSSLRGKDGPPQTSAYNSAKAGVIALTKTMGKELAPYGVIVNCVTPTALEVGMSDTASAGDLARLTALIPMGRLGRADEVAALIAWLVSDECTFSTGAVFDVSGGRATY
jgi:2-dehydro-3-deoxy-L-rhamnonate dehydrogenase (NAD+)